MTNNGKGEVREERKKKWLTGHPVARVLRTRSKTHGRDIIRQDGKR